MEGDDPVVEDGLGLEALGVTPTTVEAVLPTYLYRYRKGGQYADQEDRVMAVG